MAITGADGDGLHPPIPLSLTGAARGWGRILAWSRVRGILILAGLTGVVPDLIFNGGRPWFLYRTLALGAVALLVFGGLEQWPRRLPKTMARWVAQVLGVAIAMPLSTLSLWVLAGLPDAPWFWRDEDHLLTFGFVTTLSLLLAPWAALAALVRQKEAFARHQALAFDLERSELARQALGARLHLLQAQVAPHFLFNTLANVQALVDAGSPQASAVLRSLIAYLRAAVPRLDAPATTLGEEVRLVRAYLDLMHLRMPDRLRYTVQLDAAAQTMICPPLTVLTLVENAVRHGIDPSEDGGSIDITVERRHHRCHVRVADTGIVLGSGDVGGDEGATSGLGTGLATLRERLALVFAGDAALRLSGVVPHGVCAEVEFPAQAAVS